MNCYRCQSEGLSLAALLPYYRKLYAETGLVLRRCRDCGLLQSHVGHGEPLTPEQAAEEAPEVRE